MNERIKELRKILKLTQTEFGDRFAVKQNTIAAYESGIRTPSNSVILSICREFNVNREWLETGEGEPFIETTSRTLDKITQRYNGSEVFRAVLDAYAQLEPDEQAAVERYISMLAEAIAKGQKAESVNPATVGDTLGNASRSPDTRPDRVQGE